MFAIIWIAFWALVLGMFNEPSTGQVLAFILIGIGGPIGKWLIRTLKD